MLNNKKEIIPVTRLIPELLNRVRGAEGSDGDESR